MNKIILSFLFSFFVVFITSCEHRVMNEYSQWINKKIIIPDNMVFVKDVFDTVIVDSNYDLKIFSYNDSAGCVNCNLALSYWKPFISYVDSLTDGRVGFIHVVNISDMLTLKNVIFGNMFHYPVCIDTADIVNHLNNFSKDYNYRTFLLDKNDNVILIGNPIRNSKIRDLYLRTICERIGMLYNPINNLNEDDEIDFGTFSQTESKSMQLIVYNTQSTDMVVDTIYSSCECTYAFMDKIIIHPSDNAKLTIVYTPDAVGSFFREVYVKFKGTNRTDVFKIRGIVE